MPLGSLYGSLMVLQVMTQSDVRKGRGLAESACIKGGDPLLTERFSHSFCIESKLLPSKLSVNSPPAHGSLSH